jgi:hypothetical protein
MEALDVVSRFGDRFDAPCVVGEGSTATVLQAFDRELGVQVALKVAFPEARSTVLREFQLGAVLSHPHLPTYVQCLEADDQLMVVLEWVEGVDLADLPGPVEPDWIETLLEQVSSALGYLHTAGLVHGDLQPSNLRVGTDGWVTLLDLGFATRDEVELPAAGFSPAFAPPEWSMVDAPRPAADVYGLGRIVEDLLARATVAAPHLTDVVERMLASDPARRPAFATLEWKGRLAVPATPPSGVTVELVFGARRPLEAWLAEAHPGALVARLEPLGTGAGGLESCLELLCSGTDPGRWEALAAAFPSVAERLGFGPVPARGDSVGEFLALVEARGRPLVWMNADAASAATAAFLVQALVRAEREDRSIGLVLACRRDRGGAFLRRFRQEIARSSVVPSTRCLDEPAPSGPVPEAAGPVLSVLAVAPSPVPLGGLARAIGHPIGVLLGQLVRWRGLGWVDLDLVGDVPTVALATEAVEQQIAGRLTDEDRARMTEALLEVWTAPSMARARLLRRCGRAPEAREMALALARHGLEAGAPADAVERFAFADEVERLGGADLEAYIAALDRSSLPRATSTALVRLAEASDEPSARELRRRAASVLLAAGYADEGIDQLEGLMREAGIWVSRWVPVQLVQLLRAYNSRDHALRFERVDEPPPPLDAHRCALLYDMVTGLAMWHPFRSATAQAQHLRRALRAGHPALLVRALNAHLVQSAGYRYDPAETQRITQVLQAVCAGSRDPLAAVLLHGGVGGAAWMEMRPGDHLTALERARTALAKAPDVGLWIRDSVAIFHLVACVDTGRFDRVRALVPELLEDAIARGDRYLEAHVRVHGAFWSALAEDRPDVARAELDAGIAPFADAGQTILAMFDWFHRVRLALYEGRVHDAIALFDRSKRAWRRSTMMTLDYHLSVQAIVEGLVASAAAQVGVSAADRRVRAALATLDARPHARCQAHAAMLRSVDVHDELVQLGAEGEALAWRGVGSDTLEAWGARGVRAPSRFARVLVPTSGGSRQPS